MKTISTTALPQESLFSPEGDAACLKTFSALISTVPSAVYYKKIDGTYLTCNAAYAELIGRTRDEIVGRNDFDIFNSNVANRFFRWDSELLKGDPNQRIEARLAIGDAGERSLVLHRAILRDEQGAPLGFIGTLIDVTQSQREEQERQAVSVMAAAAEMAIQTIEGMIDPVIILDAEGHVERVNRGYAELFGLERHVIGRGLTEIFFDFSADDAAALLKRCTSQGRLRDISARVVSAAGQNLPVLVNVSILRDSQRTIDGYVVAIRDVSSLVSANEKLDQMLTEQRQAESLQRALYSISEAAYFAHDTRNLFSIVHRIVARLVPAENLLIALHNAETGITECPYYVDDAGEADPDRAQRLALSDGLVSHLIAVGFPLLLKAKEIELMRLKGLLPPSSTPCPREWLGVPLRNGEGAIVGALVAQTHRRGVSYSDGDRKILNFVSSQIAMAIERKRNEEALQAKNTQLKVLTDGTILALVKAVEIRDPYTAGHQLRVSHLAASLARELGLSDDRIEATRVAGLLHDVGKISVPSELLSKPGRLSDLEFQLIRQHPIISSNILSSIKFPYPIADFVLQHHEKLDGSGYPNGLKGDAISFESRIICVADVVDAMVSHRPYRPSRGLDLALEEIKNEEKRLYDPEVTAACVSLFRSGAFSFDSILEGVLPA